MPSQLFQKTIANWQDWGKVFQSIPDFTPLAQEIFSREQLPFAPLSPLTPGTNAVFRSGEFVIKLFAPKESGLDASVDCQVERAVCGYLTQQGIPAPKLVAWGVCEDRYSFAYLITEFFPGKEAGNLLPSYGKEEKRDFARQLRQLLQLLNQPVPGLLPCVDLVERAVHNPRLVSLPQALQEELIRRARRVDLSAPVLVHGDLTGENLLVDDSGKVVLIDCADACMAPFWYELPPVVFELFRQDAVLLQAFVGENREEFLEQLLDGLALHDFGGDILREFAKREGIPLGSLTSLEQVKQMLGSKLEAVPCG